MELQLYPVEQATMVLERSHLLLAEALEEALEAVVVVSRPGSKVASRVDSRELPSSVNRDISLSKV